MSVRTDHTNRTAAPSLGSPFIFLELLVQFPLASAKTEPERGLFFHGSGKHRTTAGVATTGSAPPTFDHKVKTIFDDFKGSAVACGAPHFPSNVHRAISPRNAARRHSLGPQSMRPAQPSFRFSV